MVMYLRKVVKIRHLLEGLEEESHFLLVENFVSVSLKRDLNWPTKVSKGSF